MTTFNQLPLDLYKNNLALLARIGKLVQENYLQWTSFGDRLIRDSVSESDAQLDALLDHDNWQNLATLPAESFWRQLQLRIGDAQTAAQIAMGSQTSFTTGLQEALSVWQQQTMKSIGNDLPVNEARRMFGDLVSPWQNLAWPMAFSESTVWHTNKGKKA